MEKISVIVPIYNVEKYLEKCLDSIINQTYKNLEIILVNDGSTDSCRDIMEKYAKLDKRIIIVDKTNGGLSDARNAGTKIATGKLISYIDSDDYIEKDMIEYLYKGIKEYNSDISICGTIVEYEWGKKIVKSAKKNYIYTTKDAIIELNSFRYFDMAVWNKLYKREIIDGIEFPVGKTSEDYFVMCKYFNRAKKVVALKDAKYHYYQRKNSISRSKKVNFDYIEGSKFQRDFLISKYPEIDYILNTAYAFSYIAVFNKCIRNKNYLSKKEVELFRTEVESNLKYINSNNKISIWKKAQSNIFVKNINLYTYIYKLLKRSK